MKKLLFICIPFLILSFEVPKINAQSVARAIDISGYWGTELKDDSGTQTFIFEISKDNSGTYSGYVNSYSNQVKLPKLKLGFIKLKASNIKILANPEQGIVYEGVLEPSHHLIKGKLIYKDKTTLSMNLQKYNKEKLNKDFPGLLNEENIFTYKKPVNLHDGFNVATPFEEGFDPKLINEMMQKVYSGEYGELHSVLIIKNGTIILEDYLGGFSINDLHALHSCTKSIASLLIGIAIDKGYIKSVDKKILDFFPDYKSLKTSNWGKIALRHILTMSSGIDWNDELDRKIHSQGDNIIETIFQRNIKNEPGTVFDYKSSDVDLIAGIIKKATGMYADKFAEKYLFKPLGINNYDWNFNKQNGNPLMDGSLTLRPRDMAKIGILVLNKGKWNGKQIISNKRIAESTAEYFKVDPVFNYGYLWWLGNSQTVTGTKIILANGWGSQFIFIVPKLNLVAVTTGNNMNNKDHFKPLKMLDQYLIGGCAEINEK
jgi:CubicO group peptidase (beta-lactamase class C family)